MSNGQRPDEQAGRAGISVIINSQQYFVPDTTVTGVQLKEIAGIPVANQLFREEPGSHPDTLIRDDETFELRRPGEHFYDLPVGVVGAPAPTVLTQIERARQDYPDLSYTEQADGVILVEIPSVPTGPSFNMAETPLLVILPAGYPEAARPAFGAHPNLLQRASQPAGTGINTFGGREWKTFCWQPSSPLDLTGPDGLWRYIKFALCRFVEV